MWMSYKQIERDAQEMADQLGVKIFAADIIYHLFDKFTAYREELKQRKREEFKHIAVFPCKLKVILSLSFYLGSKERYDFISCFYLIGESYCFL